MTEEEQKRRFRVLCFALALQSTAGHVSFVLLAYSG